MKKNMLVFDTTNLTAPDSDGRPAVRVEEVEVGVNVRVIVCTRCGKAVTPAFRWDENGGPFVLRAFVECPECVEAAPDKDARIAELEAQLADERQEFDRDYETLREKLDLDIKELCAQRARATAAEARAEAAEKQLAEAKEEIATLAFAAHMPADYPYGLPSWICQRLYAAYIAQASNKKEWNALMRALDAKERAEARLTEAEKKFKDEREHSEWLQEECNKAVDEKEEANGRAVTLEAALKAVEWVDVPSDQTGNQYCPLCKYWIWEGHEEGCLIGAALEPGRQEEPK
jgi:hypothetical protein